MDPPPVKSKNRTREKGRVGDWGWGEGADKGAKGSCGRLRYPLQLYHGRSHTLQLYGRSGVTGNGTGSQWYIVSAERGSHKVSSIEATVEIVQVPAARSPTLT